LVRLFLACFVYIIFHCNTRAQNLVINSSFEEFVDFSIVDISKWHRVQESDTPDYFNFSAVNPHNNIYNKYMGNIAPKSGDGFVGIFCYRASKFRNIKNVREFIEAPLKGTLEKDSLYRIQLSLRLDTESTIAIKNFGIYFSNSSYGITQAIKPLDIDPQVEFNSQIIENTDHWVTFHSLFKAKGGESNIVLGNFKSDRKTSKRRINIPKERRKRYKWDLVEDERASYYYIDDIIVEKIHIRFKASPDLDQVIFDTLLIIDEIEVDSAIVLENIQFEFNSSELLQQSYIDLKRLKEFLDNNPLLRIKLEGHTDNVGGYDFNLKLSRERVEAVVAYLIEKGIESSRLEYAGYSYLKPLATNETKEGRQVNRRVTFKIISK
jgi:OOP family OmpA-OmpF porin